MLLVVSSIPHIQELTAARTITTDSMISMGYKTLKSAQTAALTTVVDAYMYGNWLYTLVTVAVFPNWLMFWALLWTNPDLY